MDMSTNPPPSYAPTATTSYTTSSKDGRYETEVLKLDFMKSLTHQTIYESLAEVYSIIPTLEMIENSLLKDYITDKEKYTSTSLRLINQYQLILKGFKDDEPEKQLILKQLLSSSKITLQLPTLDNFLSCMIEKFRINCPLAIKRLQVGVPATIQHLSTQVESSSHPTPASSSSSGRLVAEITGNFITCMDAIKLNYNTKSQLHPLLSDLVVNLNDLVEASSSHNSIDFNGKSKLVNWLIKLNNLQDETLTKDECDLFLNDLDLAFKGFYSSLE